MASSPMPVQADRTVAVVAVVAGADERAVTHPAGILPGQAAGADRRRQVAVAIQRQEIDRAQRVVLGSAVTDVAQVDRPRQSTGGESQFARRRWIQTVFVKALAPAAQRFLGQLIGRLLSHLGGKPLGPATDHQHMGQLFHDPSRQRDGVAVAAQGGHGTGLQRAPVHDAGVQLDLAEHIGQAAVADAVFFRVIFDDATGQFDGVQCAAAVARIRFMAATAP